MVFRRFLRFPMIALLVALATTVITVGCGGAEEPAAPAAPQLAAASDTPAPVRATNTPAPQGSQLQPTPTQRASVIQQATPRPTLAPSEQEGVLVTDLLIVVLDPPSLESMLDCEVTGSGVVNYRMSMEYMVDANRYDGSYDPMLATEWGISDDGKVWNFKLRQGVQWHDDWGEFTAQDVAHSLAYYTNDGCRASYSDYFRNNPGAAVEIINDYEINMAMQQRPAVDFVYWLSGFRGMPISSKAQWDQGCPNGEADYGEAGYCALGRNATYEKSARTGPYEFASFEEGVGWEWTEVDYDHWRVDPDFSEIEIKDVREPATRLAIMQAREGHIGSVNRALLQEAVDNGLEIIDSSVTATMAWAIFGGLYYSTGETPEGYVEEYDIVGSRDEEMPWNIPGETGRTVRIAMNKAINRDELNEAIFEGAGARQWVGGIVPDFPAGYNPEWEERWEELYGYDPERARELLAEAGFPNGFSFRIPSYPLGGVPELPDMLEAMAGYWSEIGLDPELDPIEFSNWRNEYRGLNTECCIYPHRGPAAPIDTRVHFYYSAERFFRMYTSDDIQNWKEQALRALNEADATENWQKVSNEIYDQVGVIPGWTLPISATVDPNVVSEYVFLGPNNGTFIYLEYVKGVRE